MNKENAPQQRDQPARRLPDSQRVHDFLALQRLTRRPELPNRLRIGVWLVRKRLLHRMTRMERQELFAMLQQPSAPPAYQREEAARG